MAEVESDEMLLPYFEYQSDPPQSNTKGNVKETMEEDTIVSIIILNLELSRDVFRNYKWFNLTK